MGVTIGKGKIQPERCRQYATVFLEDGTCFCKLHSPDRMEQLKKKEEDNRVKMQNLEFYRMLRRHPYTASMITILQSLEKTKGKLGAKKLEEAMQLLEDLRRN